MLKVNSLLLSTGLVLLLLAIPNFTLASTDSINVNQIVNNGTTPPTQGGGGSTGTRLINIFNINVSAQDRFAVISWQTTNPVKYTLSWGTTLDYESGGLVGSSLQTSHEALVNNLLPNTQYNFLLRLTDKFGNEQSYIGNFTTLIERDVRPPDNVLQFAAIPKQDSISLSWINPLDADFVKLRLVRSDKFYPRDPFNGELIYEGTGTSFEDRSVGLGKIYYYSIFTVDSSGNYSSGAISSAKIIRFSDLPSIVSGPVDNNSGSGVDPDSGQDNSIDKNLSLSKNDFVFTNLNTGEVIPHNKLIINYSENIEISIPAHRVPENIEVLVLTISNSTVDFVESSFLMQLDQAKEYYRLRLPRLSQSDWYKLTVKVFDFNRNIAAEYSYELFVSSEDAGSDLTPKYSDSPWRLAWLWWILIPIVAALWLLFRRSRRSN